MGMDVLFPTADTATAVGSLATPNGEPGEDGGFILRSGECDDRCRLAAVNDGRGHDIRVERVRTAEDDVLAVEADVFGLPAYRHPGHDQRIAIGRPINPLLDLCERLF